MIDEPEGWQRFLRWEHSTLAKLTADLLLNNKRLSAENEILRRSVDARQPKQRVKIVDAERPD